MRILPYQPAEKPRTDGREKISVDLTYTTPVFDQVKLGGTPRDYFDHNPAPVQGEVGCQDGSCANLPQEVWKQVPRQTADGQPVLQSVNEHLEGAPRSTVLSFLGYGAAAGVAGALVGGVLGYFVGQPLLGAAAGFAAAGIPVGALMSRQAARDRVALEWKPHAIVAERMTGYRESVTPGELHGQSGYYHRFEPILQREILGTYQTPQIVHYEPRPQDQGG